MNQESGIRILLCSDYLPPSDGGVEQVVQNLTLHLENTEYQVGIFTLDSGKEDFDLQNSPNIKFYSSSAFDLTNVIGLQNMISVTALYKFRQVLRDFQPDIVHAHNRFFYTSALAALYVKKYNYNLVTTLHLGEIDMISGVGGQAASAYEQSIGRFIVRNSDQVICVSKAVEEVAKSLGAKRSLVIRNAVDIDKFTPADSSIKSLLYIGRLVRNNGILDLMDALPIVLEEHPEANFYLLGSGPLEDDVRKVIQSNGLGKSVTLYDYVEDISEMYNKARVFCRPSYSEGLPLTLLESMASEVTPVVTAVAGVPEVVTDYENGILLTPGNTDEIADAIIKLFSNPNVTSNLAKNARKFVMENLTWEQRTERVIQVYKHVYRNE